jgi:hypothetical protein
VTDHLELELDADAGTVSSPSAPGEVRGRAREVGPGISRASHYRRKGLDVEGGSKRGP